MNQIHDFIQSRFEGNIRKYLNINDYPGQFGPFPDSLNPKLSAALKEMGVNQLYTHQAEAFESISADQNTLLVSSTASGKTLSFFLPIFNNYVASDPSFSVMLLYPTKALSRDQEATFGKLMVAAGQKANLGTFDGDTPRDIRTRIQQSCDFLITNPDMLHGGILPNHNRKWRSFLSRLRYIVVDEVHTYRGAFGSHVANVFRRLLRICEIHGSHPSFVCSSATVGNPDQHVRSLFHKEFKVIENDGSPKNGRSLYFINPPMVESHGHALYRKGTSSVSIPLLRETAKKGIRAICFCRSRQEVERLHRAVIDGHPTLRTKIKPYRGGLLPNERRQIEKDLVSGKLTAIISTNALELGIDIGDLELCLLSGHPGTIASFWQQAGRVGRKGLPSTIVYVAKDNPIDQYLVNHPEFVTNAPIEEALLNADNPYIFLQHLPCMAHEHPLRSEETGLEPTLYEEAIEVLKADKTLVPYRDALRYALQDYPAKGVNLRGMTDYNIEIYCGSEVIGEIDPIGARGELYKDAIYQHLGQRYMSLDLNLEQKLCKVTPVSVDYYTEAHWEGRVELTEVDTEKSLGAAGLKFGLIHFNKQPKLYKKIRERTLENIGYGPITLAPFEYDTTGFSLLAPSDWKASLESVDKLYIGAAFYGLSYILRHAAPAFCMADISNIETDVSLTETDSGQWKSALYMFDTIEGGVGYAEKIYENIEECLNLCQSIIRDCECDFGCPACVPSLPPGVSNEELENFLIESNASLECAKSLLVYLLEGRIILPEVEVSRERLSPAVSAVNEDAVRVDARRKLSRASGILRQKRKREH